MYVSLIVLICLVGGLITAMAYRSFVQGQDKAIFVEDKPKEVLVGD